MVGWLPAILSVVFLASYAIRTGYVDEMITDDALIYHIDTQSLYYRFALVGCIAMTFPLLFSLFLEFYHVYTSPDKANQLQTTLQKISLWSQSCLLISVIIPSCILLSDTSSNTFWLLAHIQTHNLLQGAYFFFNAICNREEMSFEMIAFPLVLFATEVLHFESIFQEGSWQYGLVAASAASILVLLFFMVRYILVLREFFVVHAKEEMATLPEEQLSMIYLICMAVWIVGYLFFHVALQDRSLDHHVDYCLIHTLFVGGLAFALGVCNGVKTKQSAALAEVSF